MKKQTFETELLSGRKGCAVIVPFDPEQLWGIQPQQIASVEYGQRPGHLVVARINGYPFDGWIGHRWGRFFILVSEELQSAAKVAVGDIVSMEVTPKLRPRSTTAQRTKKKTKPR